MKKLIMVLFCGAFSFGAFAQDNTKHRDDTPWDYVMMKNGKLIEVQHGNRTRVKRNNALHVLLVKSV